MNDLSYLKGLLDYKNLEKELLQSLFVADQYTMGGVA